MKAAAAAAVAAAAAETFSERIGKKYLWFFILIFCCEFKSSQPAGHSEPRIFFELFMLFSR